MKRTWRALVLALACCLTLAAAMTTGIALAEENSAAGGTGYAQEEPSTGDV